MLYVFSYVISIPSNHLFLKIYTFCNLNNVSWGTREVTAKKTILGVETTKAEDTAKKEEIENKMSFFGKSRTYTI